MQALARRVEQQQQHRAAADDAEHVAEPLSGVMKRSRLARMPMTATMMQAAAKRIIGLTERSTRMDCYFAFAGTGCPASCRASAMLASMIATSGDPSGSTLRNFCQWSRAAV